MKIIFLDTETTGVEETDRLCQIAYKYHGEDICYQSLFKPPVPMSVEAMAICHITNKMLEDKKPFIGSKDFKDLELEFQGDDTILVAHNAQFDMRFLLKEGLNMPKQHICTMKLAHYHDKKAELGKHTLQYLRYYHDLPMEDGIMAHEARSDVLVLEKLYEWFLEHYTVEEMVKISSVPILYKKMPFGKYKGDWFKDIARKDLDYLLWMRRGMALDEDMKHTVEYHINNR